MPEAETDAQRIMLWKLKHHSARAAHSFVTAYDSALASLTRSPRRCRRAPEADSLGDEVRHLLLGEYRIIFRVSGSVVHVLHVRHGARLWIGQDPPDDEA
ncbi:MAG: type II toxin-antitoxin system RelE/ParE family toxin [Planctomycetota bacterium]